jgi:hypothetical protein
MVQSLQQMTSYTKHELWVIQGRFVEFMHIFSNPTSNVLLITSTMQMQICFITYQNIVWHVWITKYQFQTLMTRYKHTSLSWSVDCDATWTL